MQLDTLIHTYQLRRDAWQSDYESALQWEDPDSQRQDINPNLEVPSAQWQPIARQMSSSQAMQEMQSLIVVDGIRRLHLRTFFNIGAEMHYGGIGSVAVGALMLTPGTMISIETARIDQLVRRFAIFCDTDDLVGQETLIPGLPIPVQHLSAVSDFSPQGPVKALHDQMRVAEEELVARLDQVVMGAPQSLILVDGPLQRRNLKSKRPLVGFVKSLMTKYLPTELEQILYHLSAGQRSPIFGIGEDRYSCYVRLGEPGLTVHGLSGVIRLEMSTQSINLEKSIQLASQLAVLLPELVAPVYKDPRAPQNLAPISALERELRRAIGNETLIQRRLEAYLHQVLKQIPSPVTHSVS